MDDGPVEAASYPDAKEMHITEEEPSREKHVSQALFLKSFLSQINKNLPEAPGTPEQIDVVIAGGGMKGYFVVGAWSVLRTLINQGRFIVRRWAGTSVGACSAVYMCCGVDPVTWASCYWQTRRLMRGRALSLMESFEYISNILLPDNAHQICSGKVFLSITLLTLTGPKNILVSEFRKKLFCFELLTLQKEYSLILLFLDSKEDLIEAVVASCSIPFMTTKRIGKSFRGLRVLDGGFTNNTPVFPSSDVRQLVGKSELIQLFSQKLTQISLQRYFTLIV
jgi:predicted acylesterase/phospholipase RssA